MQMDCLDWHAEYIACIATYKKLLKKNMKETQFFLFREKQKREKGGMVATITKVSSDESELPWLQECSADNVRTEQMKDRENKKIIKWREVENIKTVVD